MISKKEWLETIEEALKALYRLEDWTCYENKVISNCINELQELSKTL